MISDSHGFTTTITGQVVVVEDDALMRGILVGLFTDLGAECAAFVTADDALIHLMQSSSPCSLLVTDYTLPGQLDGKELALMVNERWPEVPIVVTTGYGSEIGDDLPPRIAFLRKPWSIGFMIATVEELMQAASGTSLNSDK